MSWRLKINYPMKQSGQKWFVAIIDEMSGRKKANLILKIGFFIVRLKSLRFFKELRFKRQTHAINFTINVMIAFNDADAFDLRAFFHHNR